MIIGVTSTVGGAGTTLVATNVAAWLAKQSPTLITEWSQESVIEVLYMRERALSQAYLTVSDYEHTNEPEPILKTSYNLAVLPGTLDCKLKHFYNAISVAKNINQFVVIDLGNCNSLSVRKIMGFCNVIYLVIEPTNECMQSLERLSNIFSENNLDGLNLIINKTSNQSYYHPRDMARYLGIERYTVLQLEPKLINKAAANRQPLVYYSKGKLSTSLKFLADNINKNHKARVDDIVYDHDLEDEEDVQGDMDLKLDELPANSDGGVAEANFKTFTPITPDQKYIEAQKETSSHRQTLVGNSGKAGAIAGILLESKGHIKNLANSLKVKQGQDNTISQIIKRKPIDKSHQANEKTDMKAVSQISITAKTEKRSQLAVTAEPKPRDSFTKSLIPKSNMIFKGSSLNIVSPFQPGVAGNMAAAILERLSQSERLEVAYVGMAGESTGGTYFISSDELIMSDWRLPGSQSPVVLDNLKLWAVDPIKALNIQLDDELWYMLDQIKGKFDYTVVDFAGDYTKAQPTLYQSDTVLLAILPASDQTILKTSFIWLNQIKDAGNLITGIDLRNSQVSQNILDIISPDFIIQDSVESASEQIMSKYLRG